MDSQFAETQKKKKKKKRLRRPRFALIPHAYSRDETHDALCVYTSGEKEEKEEEEMIMHSECKIDEGEKQNGTLRTCSSLPQHTAVEMSFPGLPLLPPYPPRMSQSPLLQ